MVQHYLKDIIINRPPDSDNNIEYRENVSAEPHNSKGLNWHEQKAKIDKANADLLLRNKYSFKAYKIVKKSLWGWAILLAIYGSIKFLTRDENNGHGFEIFSDTALIAITSATTLNIFAAFLSLVKGLFPSLKEDKKGKSFSML